MTNKISIISQSPYYDDFDSANGYVRVLFRPSYPVQARELTTLQTILQNQVSSFGDRMLKDGSRVTDGKLSIIKDAQRLTLSGTGNTVYTPDGAETNSNLADISELEGKIITNADRTVKAMVLNQPVQNNKAITGSLYIKYITGEQFPADGGFIYADPVDNPGETLQFYNTYSAKTDCSVGQIEQGVYYVKGIFNEISRQTVVIDDDSTNPTKDLGISVVERAVTHNDDSSLYDNARGTTNEGAPGAHRLKLEMTFQAVTPGAVSDSSFYRLATIVNGNLQEDTETDKYMQSILDVLAERTMDESGNYTVIPLTGIVEPSATNDSEFNVIINPSKSYVEGYKIDQKEPVKLTFDRGNDTKEFYNYQLAITGPTFIYTEETTNPGFTENEILTFQDETGNSVGICRFYSFESTVVEGELKNKLYIYDIRMFQNVTVDDATSLSVGDDFTQGTVSSYIYAINGNDLTLVNSSGDFSTTAPGHSFRADQTVSITAVNRFTLTTLDGTTSAARALITTITDGANTSTVYKEEIDAISGVSTPKVYYGNINPTLIHPTGTHVRNLQPDDVAGHVDVQFESTVDSHSNAQVKNKTLKFAYMKIKNRDVAEARTAAYGWLAEDREINLGTIDVHTVYGINRSTDNTFDNGRFTRINISTSANVLQGYELEGQQSGAKAIVALNKTIAVTGAENGNQFNVNDTDYHQTEIGSGLSGVVEVVFTKGQKFTDGETLTVKNLANGDEFIQNVTFTDIHTEPTGTNITSNYLLDDGQRPEYYDISRLILKSNSTRPSAGTGDLVVFFSYFEHQAGGQFYSADSYSSLDKYDVDVKYFKDPVEILRKRSTAGTDLRNCLDFRQRVDLTNPSVNNNLFTFNNRSFLAFTKVKPASEFVMDYTTYLGRIDTVSLMKDGSFNIIKGIPALEPRLSSKKIKGMKIFDITIPPIPRYLDEEIKIDWVDNKRYTMRDIGDLETRISRLEDAVSLSLLESQALIDDVGLRTKMGIIVDDFSTVEDYTNTPADFEHEDFNCSFDIIKKELIPGQTDGTMVPVEITKKTNVSDFFPNYIVKAFTEEAMLDQSLSTGTHKINPFGTWVFQALVALDPSMDSWRIRKNDYFTNHFGDVQPFIGNDSEFAQFQQITTTSPGGSSTTRSEWVGSQRTTRSQVGRNITTNTFQARKTITTTTFDKPRAVAGSVAETLTGSEVIQNPQNYWMRSITINYTVEGLKPSTPHNVTFANTVVVSNISSDADGKLSGSFVIPSMTYRAGVREVMVKDVETNGANSQGIATFTSQGHIDSYNIIQDVSTVGSTESTTPNVLRSSVTRREPRDRGDPIAQMFMLPVSEVNGVGQRYSSIITSIDLWLNNVDTRTSMNKLIVEIRATHNGYPGGPADTLGTSGEITLAATDGVDSPTVLNSKNIKFLQPIKLYSDKEYAIVIKSPSDATAVFIAKMGETLIDGTGIHTSQPNVGGYFGSFFISQNQTTWEPEQNVDLTFKLNRAKFDTGTTSVIEYENIISNTGIFRGDIGAFNKGLTMTTYEHSDLVQVHHPNHGMLEGDTVTIETGPFVSNGIADSDVNGDFDIKFPTLNTYFIKAKTNKATASGRIDTGTFTTFATQNVIYDSLMTNYNIIKEEEDDVELSLITYYGNSTDKNNNAKVTRNITPSYSFGTDGDFWNDHQVNSYSSIENIYETNSLIDFDYPMIVKNDINDDEIADTTLKLTLTLGNSNDYSAPFYKINNLEYPIVFRNLTGYMLDKEDLEVAEKPVLEADDSDGEIERFTKYIAASETITENSDYVTKEIELEYPADGFTVFFDADMAPGSELHFSFKAKESGEDRSIEDLSWIDFPATQQVNETNHGSFNSFEDFKSYEVRTTDDVGINLYENAETNIDYEFQSFKLRIRMKVNNSAVPPRIKNLRIIADL
ncbi:MAG: DUF4815 domain-containing protein [Candidatus Thiodiazotropha taylori]|uniref:DUF4815 domain-containing protein n=1 Tax=Candidatus Thiodiazotropha taylori TaxID=2792791 RepID=A0A9E4K9D6_9GAMM|nr:DUF4815 domain-containing protein [Candidatus Thiodiazotropha taylori]MCW4254999.1 DUF4815 domain-containing protein [Candidatus Thiodiazotropha taylori]